MTSKSSLWRAGETRVFAVQSVDLRVVPGVWPFACEHAREISAHWERRRREAPAFFNGAVFALVDFAVSEAGALSGRLVRTDFKSNLYWRETGCRDTSVMDAFGSALLFSAEAQVLVGRQRAGNLNSGLYYPPSGFIDAGDVSADGHIDIDGSALRETAEETGLSASHLERTGGYFVTMADGLMSIAVPFHSRLSGAALLSAATRHIALDDGSEVAEFLLVTPGDTKDLPMPDYARAMLDHIATLESLG